MQTKSVTHCQGGGKKGKGKVKEKEKKRKRKGKEKYFLGESTIK